MTSLLLLLSLAASSAHCQSLNRAPQELNALIKGLTSDSLPTRIDSFRGIVRLAGQQLNPSDAVNVPLRNLTAAWPDQTDQIKAALIRALEMGVDFREKSETSGVTLSEEF